MNKQAISTTDADGVGDLDTDIADVDRANDLGIGTVDRDGADNPSTSIADVDGEPKYKAKEANGGCNQLNLRLYY